MKNAVITDVFFDLDHTLWDFEKNSALAFEAIFESEKMDIDQVEFLKHYVPINLKYWELYRMDKISQSELRYGRLKECFDLTGYSISDREIDLISIKYIELLPTYNHLFEGAIELLDYLKDKYSLHIITNGFQTVQDIKMEKANIRHYFQTVTNSELAGVKKPNAVIFEYALKAANTQKDRSIMIGDCINADVYGALNCGMDAILFHPAPCGVEEITQIKHLTELKNYL